MTKKNLEALGDMLKSATPAPAERFITSTEKGEIARLKEEIRQLKLKQERKSERIQLLVRPTLKDRLDQIAKERKISRNELITEILERAVSPESEATT